MVFIDFDTDLIDHPKLSEEIGNVLRNFHKSVFGTFWSYWSLQFTEEYWNLRSPELYVHTEIEIYNIGHYVTMTYLDLDLDPTITMFLIPLLTS